MKIKTMLTKLFGKARSAYSFCLFRPLAALICLAFITACSGGSSSDSTSAVENTTNVQTVGGNATKGPLANADVKVFALDTSAKNLRGAQIASGITNSQANIRVDLPVDAQGLLLVVVTANANTIDLTTGQPPVLTRLSTVAEASEWLGGQPVYATPLSHMAVGIAARNIGGTTEVSTAKVRSALAQAQQVVRKTVGFDLLDDAGDPGGPIDLFTTAPVLTNSSVDASSRQRSLRYRKASEAVVAVIANISGDTETAAIETFFDSLTDDLADGRVDDSAVAADLEAVDPEALPIPNASGQTIADTLTILNLERTSVGVDNQSVADLGVTDDMVSQNARTDSKLTSADLAGEVGELSLETFPAAAGNVALASQGSAQQSVFEVSVGETVTVTASASEGFAFERWTKDGVELSSNSSFSFSTDSTNNLVAEFSANLAVKAAPKTGGAPLADQEFFEPGAMVTLTANPEPGFEFYAWVNSEGNRPGVFAEDENLKTPASFTMPENPLSLIAVYAFTALTDSDTQQGEVSQSYDEDGNVLLTATPQTGFIFVQWINQNGNVLSKQQADFQVDLTEFGTDSQITAVFAKEPLKAAVWDETNWDKAAWQ
ncbi:InlB B-repeat-containing protein [Marinobacter sp.]|uniref:InlB B-repeat-containing protein n=1 Tax=Marinobacter sp. TaxID=50741 RepID=UPI003A920D6C